ncbi:hypothetical protein AB5I41_28150 [Sphingomonas sp. MMS24-JH45]
MAPSGRDQGRAGARRDAAVLRHLRRAERPGARARDPDGGAGARPRRADRRAARGGGGAARDGQRAAGRQPVPPARRAARARQGAHRCEGEGGGARPRPLRRRLSRRAGRDRRRAGLGEARGKPVLAYATGYTDGGYRLAAAASEVS